MYEDHPLLVFDIETIPIVYNYEELSDTWKYLWDKKASYFIEKEGLSAQEAWKQKAGIYAEFGKVLCISSGFLDMQDPAAPKIHIKNHYSSEETETIDDFISHVESVRKKYPRTILAGHNIAEFDIPFLCRRITVHKMDFPSFMPASAAKPWEFQCFDTLKQWRFGDYKHFISLDLLANLFGVPSTKQEMSGSMVGDFFYEKKDINAILDYCDRDVVLTARVVLHYLKHPDLKEENIRFLRKP